MTCSNVGDLQEIYYGYHRAEIVHTASGANTARFVHDVSCTVHHHTPSATRYASRGAARCSAHLRSTCKLSSENITPPILIQ